MGPLQRGGDARPPERRDADDDRGSGSAPEEHAAPLLADQAAGYLRAAVSEERADGARFAGAVRERGSEEGTGRVSSACRSRGGQVGNGSMAGASRLWVDDLQSVGRAGLPSRRSPPAPVRRLGATPHVKASQAARFALAGRSDSTGVLVTGSAPLKLRCVPAARRARERRAIR